MSGLIELFCETVGEAIESPPDFVWWSGVAMTSALMGRQIHTTIRTNDPHDWLFGNIFVLLVGPPGSGKTDAIIQARRLVRQAKVEMMPDDISGERLIHFAKTPDKSDIPRGTTSAFLDEFNQLFHDANATALKRVLTSFYDCRRDPYNRETHAHGPEKVEDMCLTMIAGATPAHMAECFRPREWQEGLPSRIVYVYAPSKVDRESFRRGDMAALALEVARVQEHVFRMNALVWEAKATEARLAWTRQARKDEPIHPLLEGYNTRRPMMATKLALVLATARRARKIELVDWEGAIAALLHTETGMGRALSLAGGNEYRDIEDWLGVLLEKQAMIPEWQVRRWIGQRVSPHMVEMVLGEMVAQQRILVSSGEKPARMFKRPAPVEPAKKRKK